MSPKKTEKSPTFMVHISDPKTVRKDLLESLREIILFMQGYEKFRSAQSEKIHALNKLKNETRDMLNMVDSKLRRLLPRGKIPAIKNAGKPAISVSYQPKKINTKPRLNDLEAELAEIEKQLQNI